MYDVDEFKYGDFYGTNYWSITTRYIRFTNMVTYGILSVTQFLSMFGYLTSINIIAWKYLNSINVVSWILNIVRIYAKDLAFNDTSSGEYW